VRVSQEFAQWLAALDDDALGAVDGRGTLTDSLRQLGLAAVRAVPSCWALSVTVQPLGRPYTVVLAHDAADASIVSSLRMRIPLGAEEDARLVLYAAAPGAFDVLAGLLSRRDGRGAAVVDDDLALPVEATRDLLSQLDDLTAISRATGVLLDQGTPPEATQTALEEKAERAGVDLLAAAKRLLAETAGPHPDA
jgi:hypothetical protein